MAVEIEITADHAGQRLDRLVKAMAPHVGFGAQQKWFRTGQVRLNGKRVKGAERVDWAICFACRRKRSAKRQQAASATDNARPQPLIRAWSSSYKIARFWTRARFWPSISPPAWPCRVAVKPPGMLTARCQLSPTTSGEVPRLVHRLDRDTSGVLLVGRGRETAAFLTKAFASRDARKTYFALVTDWPEGEDAGVISAPLIKARQGGEERVIVDFDHEDAQSAETLFRVERRAANGLVLLSMEPRTGRTHQLRVHAAHFGGTIVGDGKYGRRLPGDWSAPKRLYLHAASLELPHPDGSIIRLSAPLPSAFEVALNA